MGDLTILGNAAAVPIIIGITQFLKNNLSFKYKADVVAVFVSIIVCFGWSFYNTPNNELDVLSAQSWPVLMKAFIGQLIIVFATWMSASKSYDLFHGNKKRETRHTVEKEGLLVEVERLKNGKTEEKPIEEDVVLTNKLRQILGE